MTLNRLPSVASAAAILIGIVLSSGACALGASHRRPHAAPDKDSWASLRRPLRVPRISAGTCPRTRGGRAAPDAGITLGRGPAYPALGMPAAPPDRRGVVDVSDDVVNHSFQFHKTLFAVAPKYRGRVLVRGAKLGGPRIRFHTGAPVTSNHIGGTVRREYRFARGGEARKGWRYGVGDSVLHGAGCYFFQFDGSSFSRTVIFEVR
jgi:hypothetical protein